MDSAQNGNLLRRLSAEDLDVLTRLITRLILEVVQGLEAAGNGARVPAGTARTFDGPVLVEHDVFAALAAGVRVLRVGSGTLLSPLAVDTARERGLVIEREA